MRPRVLREAESEALAAALWYEDQRPGLGDDFYNEVLAAFEAIGRSPLRFPIYEAYHKASPVRRAAVKRFPYYVIYRTGAEGTEPIVIAVSHAKRRPGYWSDRG